MRIRNVLLAIAVLVGLVGCGGGGLGIPSTIWGVTPTELTIAPGASTQILVDTNSNFAQADWSAPDGGTVVDGLFTAPNTPGTYRVIADSFAIPGLGATATVHVEPVQISITPATLGVPRGSANPNALTAVVTGTGNQAVTWSIDEVGGGTISSGTADGSGNARANYTAPAGTGTATIRATSVADPTATATAKVKVLPPNTLILSPSGTVLKPSQTAVFTATFIDSSGNLDTTTPLVWEFTNNPIGATLTGADPRQRTFVPPPGFVGNASCQFWVRNPATGQAALATVTVKS
jgi:hypothetical protein